MCDKIIIPFAKTLLNEYGYDDEDSIYERSDFSNVCILLFEKKNIYKKELYKKSETKKITILEQKGYFYWGVDHDGRYWKRYKNYAWKKMEFKTYEQKRVRNKIIYADKSSYLTRERGCKTIIKRDNYYDSQKIKGKRLKVVNVNLRGRPRKYLE